jgi:hypothetical protein
LTEFVENFIQIKCGALKAGGRVRRPFQIKSKPNRVQMKAQRVTIILLIFHHKKRGKGRVMAFVEIVIGETLDFNCMASR